MAIFNDITPPALFFWKQCYHTLNTTQRSNWSANPKWGLITPWYKHQEYYRQWMLFHQGIAIRGISSFVFDPFFVVAKSHTPPSPYRLGLPNHSWLFFLFHLFSIVFEAWVHMHGCIWLKDNTRVLIYENIRKKKVADTGPLLQYGWKSRKPDNNRPHPLSHGPGC